MKIDRLSRLLQDAHFKELVSKGSISLVVKILGVAMGFIFQWIISNYYGVSSLGLLMSAISVLSLFLLFGKLGLDTAFLRFVAQFTASDERDRIYSIRRKSLLVLIISGIAANTALYFSAGYISVEIFSKPELEPFLRFLSFASLPMALYQFDAEGLRGLKRIKEYTLIHSTGRFFFGTAAFLLLFYVLDKMVHPALLFTIGVFVTALVGNRIWQCFVPNKAAERSDTSESYSNIFGLSLPLLLASSSAFFMTWTDTLMLTYFASSEQVAIYTIAMKYAMLGKIMLMSVNSIAAPKFAEFFGVGDFAGLEKVVKQSTKLIFWTSLPLLLLLSMFPGFFLGLYGEAYRSGIVCMLILLAGQFFAAISGPVGNILQMAGKQIVYQKISVVFLVVNIVLNFILIPKYGITGAAVAGFVTTVLRNIVSIVVIKKNFGFTSLYIPLISR